MPPLRRRAHTIRRGWRHRSGRAMLVAVFAGSLAGCGGEPTYYALNAVPGAPRTAPGGTVEVRTPTVAGYLDRDYIVSGIGDDDRLMLAGNDTWAEPIADTIGRAVASDLAGRLPDAHVITEDDAVTATPGWTVELAISHFDRENGAVAVAGTLAIRRHDAGPPLIERFDLRQPAPPGPTGTLVATLSALTGTLADRIADRLQALSLAAPPPPPLPIGDAPPA